MPIQDISTGKDIQATFYDNQNGLITTTRLKQVSIKQNVVKETTKSLDGTKRHINIPDGWEVNCEYERTSNVLHDYIAANEFKYLNGQQMPLMTVIITITEANGGLSQYKFSNAVVDYDGGMWKADTYVTEKLVINSNDCKKLV
jgi:predicted Zn-dependent protease